MKKKIKKKKKKIWTYRSPKIWTYRSNHLGLSEDEAEESDEECTPGLRENVRAHATAG